MSVGGALLARGRFFEVGLLIVGERACHRWGVVPDVLVDADDSNAVEPAGIIDQGPSAPGGLAAVDAGSITALAGSSRWLTISGLGLSI